MIGRSAASSGIGVASGTPAPTFTGKDSKGEEISLANMKGNVVVLEFFGTMFKASNIGSLDIQSMSTGEFKDKGVKFIGMACREPNDAAAVDYFKNNGLTDGTNAFWIPIAGPILGGLIGGAAWDFAIRRYLPVK